MTEPPSNLPPVPQPTAHDSEREQRRMRGAATVFAVATAFSRVAGMVRTVVVAALFGTSTALSAFTVAFQIPNLIRALVADAALSAAFVPVFTELNERQERERAWRVASTMLTLIVLVLGPITVLAMVFAPQVVGLFIDEQAFGPRYVELTVDLARIMMPIILLMAISGLVVGILNAHDHFSTPALAPIAWNLVILVSLLAVAPLVPEDDRIYVYAVGTLLGTLVQLLMPVPWLRGRGGRLSFARAVRDPKIREILLLMLPVTISLGLINLQQLVDTAFSTHVPAGWFPDGVDAGAGPAILENAFRIYMLPQGIFSVAISTVFFPALTRLVVRADWERFGTTFADGLRQIFLLLLPSAAFIIVLAEPVVRIICERGEFDPVDTVVVADALAAFSVGLVFNGASLLLIRAFFSLRRPWLPTTVAVLTLVVNAVVDVLLYRDYGTTGIAFATSIVNVVSFGVLYLLLRRRVPARLGGRRTLVVVLLGLAASALAAGAGYGAWSLVDGLLGRSLPAQVASMLAAVAVWGGIYLGIVLRLKLVDRAVLASMLRRGKEST